MLFSPSAISTESSGNNGFPYLNPFLDTISFLGSPLIRSYTLADRSHAQIHEIQNFPILIALGFLTDNPNLPYHRLSENPTSTSIHLTLFFFTLVYNLLSNRNPIKNISSRNKSRLFLPDKFLWFRGQAISQNLCQNFK